MSSQQHQAAIANESRARFTLSSRPTPTPGADEVLIQVKCLALNPVDAAQRDKGFPPAPFYPAILGSDVAGFVVRLGSNVAPESVPPVGSRVVAFASCFYHNGSNDHAAFQEYVLTSPNCVTALPDQFSFEEGSLFPLGVLTALSSWTSIGIPLETKLTPRDKKAVLIWGGASSVGTFSIQSAKMMGYTVYATASTANHALLRELGADAIFDYKSDNAVPQIVERSKQDGVNLKTAVAVVPGSLQAVLQVLDGTRAGGTVKVAHPSVLPPDRPQPAWAEVRFVLPPLEPTAQQEHFRKCYNVWLTEGLRSGVVKPSPRVQIMEGGLAGLNEGLDEVARGLSGTKIVVPL